MKDLSNLMKQAQEMQEKLQAAQARLAETEVEGSAGGGMVRLILKGSGALTRLVCEDSLLTSGGGEMLGDLVIAAHADAKRKLDDEQTRVMRDVAGPLANLPGMPRF